MTDIDKKYQRIYPAHKKIYWYQAKYQRYCYTLCNIEHKPCYDSKGYQVLDYKTQKPLFIGSFIPLKELREYSHIFFGCIPFT